MAAEWCEHDPPVLIHRKGDTPVQSRITFAGMASQASVDALGSPDGHINTNGDLVILISGPSFPWAFRIVTKWGQRGYAHIAYGSADQPLTPGRSMRIVVNLPEA